MLSTHLLLRTPARLYFLLYSPPNRLRRAGWRASSGWRGTRRWQKDFAAADAADFKWITAWSTHGNGESKGAQRHEFALRSDDEQADAVEKVMGSPMNAGIAIKYDPQKEDMFAALYDVKYNNV